MRSFAPHKAILALREIPDATLAELIRSHKVTEDVYLANDDASGMVCAWHLTLGVLLRAEQGARSGGNPPDNVRELVKLTGDMSNTELGTILGYLKEYANFQQGALKDFAKALFVEVFASILDYGQASQSQITYN